MAEIPIRLVYEGDGRLRLMLSEVSDKLAAICALPASEARVIVNRAITEFGLTVKQAEHIVDLIAGGDA